MRQEKCTIYITYYFVWKIPELFMNTMFIEFITGFRIPIYMYTFSGITLILDTILVLDLGFEFKSNAKSFHSIKLLKAKLGVVLFSDFLRSFFSVILITNLGFLNTNYRHFFKNFYLNNLA